MALQGPSPSDLSAGMTFASIQFLFYFLPLFLVLYFVAKTIKTRNAIFVVFSLIFYSAGYTPHLLLLLFSIFVNYRVALAIDGRVGDARKKVLVWGVVFNVALLGVFKYTSFILDNIDALLMPFDVRIPVPHFDLPLGISFYSFHAISYIADIYKGRVRANRDPLQFILYMTMFPQLVAGPIVRYSTVARQLGRRRTTWGRFSAGARMFAIGLAWKVMIADEVAPLVAAVFDGTSNPSLIDAWLGVYAYAIQIYFDFGGYSAMAVGLGVMVGFTLPRNFRIPYAARSITEFWRRWHMSLSSWLRDYVYITLGGNRRGLGRTYANLWAVFLLCGLWHGASWNFVIWGAHHGAFLVLERAFLGRHLARGPKAVAHLYTFLAVLLGWVWFRAETFDGALEMFAGLFGLNGVGGFSFAIGAGLYPLSAAALIVGGLIGLWKWPRLRTAPALRPVVAILDYAMVAAIMIVSVLWIGGGPAAPFLYYRF
ncbi:MBOAT family O-acyltransferase [Aquabacter spiritensis]|uniref:Probable alginate O-acetylase AlgI n=1 Tax=Aquabacter spiritensis TaxID=933073 RepID=A0A4R3LW40_9HYPH|nr:MBOAT family protein [Aquabacter spiritensis]TCT02855.1 D-alanyl-lipoteichoic acid acyltransferase DltB (MBOAT superfamily) [Aquabacter spiritensis]